MSSLECLVSASNTLAVSLRVPDSNDGTASLGDLAVGMLKSLLPSEHLLGDFVFGGLSSSVHALNIVHLLKEIRTLTQSCRLRSADHPVQGSSGRENPLDREIRDRRNYPICFFQLKLEEENPMCWPSDNLF